MQLLLYVTGLHSQAKVQAVTEKLGILEPYQLYGISEETWTQYSVVLSNSALSLVETDRLKAVSLWAHMALKEGKQPEDLPDDFAGHIGVRNVRGFDAFATRVRQNFHNINRQPQDLHTIKMMERMTEILDRQTKADLQHPRDRPGYTTRLNMDGFSKRSAADFPKIPGRSWKETKEHFMSSVHSQGLGYLFQPDLYIDKSNQAEIGRFNNDNKFLKAVLFNKITGGNLSWIVHANKDKTAAEIWKAIVDWKEKRGTSSTSIRNARNFLMTKKFTRSYPGGYDAFVNDFFMHHQELVDHGRGLSDLDLADLFIDAMQDPAALTTVQNAMNGQWDIATCLDQFQTVFQHLRTREQRNTNNANSSNRHSSMSTLSNSGIGANQYQSPKSLRGYLTHKDGVPADVWRAASAVAKQTYSNMQRQRSQQGTQTGSNNNRSSNRPPNGHNNNQGLASANYRNPNFLPSGTWNNMTPNQRQIYQRGLNNQGNNESNSNRTNGGGSNNNSGPTNRNIRLTKRMSINKSDGDPQGLPSTHTQVASLQSACKNIHYANSHQEHNSEPDRDRHIRALSTGTTKYACVDGGADTCFFNKHHVHVESTSLRTVDLNMVGPEGKRPDVPIGTVLIATRLQGASKPIILVFHEAMIGNKAKDIDIISCQQVRAYGHKVHDSPHQYSGGKQAIELAHSATKIPIRVRHALMIMPFRKPSKTQLETCERIIMTGDDPWTPSAIQEELYTNNNDDDDESWEGDDDKSINEAALNSIPSLVSDSIEGNTDDQWAQVNLSIGAEPDIDAIGYNQRDTTDDYLALSKLEPLLHGSICKKPPSITQSHCIAASITENRQLKDDIEALRPMLGWVPADTVRKTIDATTQLAKNVLRLPMRRHFKSREPALNRQRLGEKYATDTFYSDTKAIGGATCAQIFVGTTSAYTRCFGMMTESEAPTALEDFIRKVGAPHTLRNDNSKVQTGKRWKEILRKYAIKDETTEPHHPNQNPAERRIQDCKSYTRRIMDRSGAPASTWLLCLDYVCMLLNVLANEKNGGRTPTEVAFGITPDISAFLQFHFFQSVLYHDPTESFPHSREKTGRFVGITDSVGDTLTYWILTDDSGKIIARSDVRPAQSKTDPNIRAETNHHNHAKADGELESSKTANLESHSEMTNSKAMVIDPTELTGYTYVDTKDGYTQKAEVTRHLGEDQWLVKFLHGGEERRSYNDLINLINKTDESGEKLWTFESITGHKKEKGVWIVDVLWDDGSTSWEPLTTMKTSDPVTVAQYALNKNLTDLHGWRWAKDYMPDGRTIRLLRRVLTVARRKARSAPVYKFGHKVPRNTRQAYEFDKINGNTLWADAIADEMGKMRKFGTFRPLDPGERLPSTYQRVPMHMCFDVKWDGRHKARLVAGGNHTTPDYQYDFNGTVSSESVRIGMFLAALNNLNVMVGDVSNAYLYAKTKEQVYTIAGREFGPDEGKLMVIEQACYGLRASNAAFGELLSHELRKLRWNPSRADPKLWYRDAGDHYDYLATYVDDIVVFSKEPRRCIAEIERTFELKGVGPPQYFLGGDFGITPNGIIYSGATKYVETITKKVEDLLGIQLKKRASPMDCDYHPELDDTPLLSEDDHSIYRMILGSVQWAVTLGRLDAAYAVATMARYAAMPQKGHLQAAIRIMGYLKGTSSGRILYDARRPDYSNLKVTDHYWGDLYPDAVEEIDDSNPLPKGKEVVLSCFVDADHARDVATRRSVTGVIVFLNNTPIRWYSKRQATVESSTYGSELVAARIATEMVQEFRSMLRSLGVPIRGPGILLGDNKSVVTNTTLPSSTLKKKHNAIAFHKVRETIASGAMVFIHIPGTVNPADILTKPLGPHIHRKLSHPLLHGNPLEIAGGGEYQRGVHPSWIEITGTIREEAELSKASNGQVKSRDKTNDMVGRTLPRIKVQGLH